MSLWKIDLTTEDGAANAAATGGMACFVMAGLSVLGVAILAGTGIFSAAARMGVLGYGAASVLVFLAAGWRLRSGKGAFWGIAAALLLVIEIVSKLVTMSGIGFLIVNVIVLIVVVNGVRGAWALRKGGFDEDAVEVFE